MGTLIKRGLVVIVVLAALAVGAAIYFGMIDSRDITTPLRVEGSKLGEEIKSGLGDIGPARGGTPEQANLCRDNLRRIEAAKKTVAARMNITVGSVSEAEVAKQLGGSLPVCPVGGKYTLGTLESNARCSVGSNGTADPGDDHLLPSY